MLGSSIVEKPETAQVLIVKPPIKVPQYRKIIKKMAWCLYGIIYSQLNNTLAQSNQMVALTRLEPEIVFIRKAMF